MKTGDLIAFSGKGRLSDIIKWKTRSQISHVGMVLRLDLGEGMGDSVMLIESTTLIEQPDALTRLCVKGVQIHFLSQRLDTYDGDCWWTPLISDLPSNVEMVAWLRETHAKRVPYDTCQALGAGMDLFDSLGLRNDPDFEKLFCSELVARALQIGGALPSSPQILNTSELTPQDLISYTGLFGKPLVKLK